MPLLFAIGVATSVAAVFQAPMSVVLITGLVMSVLLFAEQTRDMLNGSGALARRVSEAVVCGLTGILMAFVAFAGGRLAVFFFGL